MTPATARPSARRRSGLPAGYLRKLLPVVLAGLLGLGADRAAGAERAAAQRPPAPAAADPVRYATAALIDGFERTVFGVEARSRRDGRAVERVKRWHPDGMRIAIVNLAEPDRSDAVKAFAAVMERTIQNLKARVVTSAGQANAVVYLVRRAEFRDVIRRTMPAGYDTGFLESNDCTAVTGGPDPQVLSLAFIYLVADEGERDFHHCLVEETLQALGPVNDSTRLPDSIFNDANRVERFELFDWYILNMLFDDRIRPGMTRAEARKVLPAVVADLRRRERALRAAGDLPGAEAAPTAP